MSKTWEYERAHIATVASKSGVTRVAVAAFPCALVGEVPNEPPNGEVENPEDEVWIEEEEEEKEKGEAKVGEEEKGVAIEGEEERGCRGTTPRATSSSNSFELLITAHIVLTKSEPNEMALMIEWVWVAEDAVVTWEGKRAGEVTKSTKRERAERPAEAMAEKGGEEVGACNGTGRT